MLFQLERGRRGDPRRCGQHFQSLRHPTGPEGQGGASADLAKAHRLQEGPKSDHNRVTSKAHSPADSSTWGSMVYQAMLVSAWERSNVVYVRSINCNRNITCNRNSMVMLRRCLRIDWYGSSSRKSPFHSIHPKRRLTLGCTRNRHIKLQLIFAVESIGVDGIRWKRAQHGASSQLFFGRQRESQDQRNSISSKQNRLN